MAVLVLLVGGATLAGVSVVGGDPPPPVTATEVIRFEPLPPPGETARDGACFTVSLSVNGRDDAWRWELSSPRSIDDPTLFAPCFEAAPGTVVCGADPVAGAPGFLLRLTRPLPVRISIPDTPQQYWLLELEDGTHCRFATGATGGADGERANYLCSDERWLLGHVLPGEPLTARRIRIEQALDPDFHIEDAEVVAIRRAWR